MKTQRVCRTLVLTVVTMTLLGQPHLRAADLDWDPGHTGNSGGTGVWDNGVTANWGTNVTWNNANSDNGFFHQTPGTVTVTGTVVADSLIIQGLAGNYIFDSDITTPGILTKSGANADQTFVNMTSTNASDVTINADMNLDVAGNTDRFYYINSSANTTLTLNGNVTLTGSFAGGNTNRSITFTQDTATSNVVLNGTFSNGSSGKNGNIRINESGASDQASLTINGDVSGFTSPIELFQGNLLIGTSANLGTSQIVAEYGGRLATNRSILTDGDGVVVSNQVLYGNAGPNAGGTFTVGSAAAGNSEFSGNIHVYDDGILTLTAVAGSTVTFSNNIDGGMQGPLIKTGLGTVVLASTTTAGNYYSSNGTSNVAADLQAGKTVISNTSGSAFGYFGSPTQVAKIVDLHSGATLAGTGVSLQKIVAEDSGSILSPGDTDGTIGTLHLTGGLDALSGLTLQFDLGSLSGSPLNDVIDLGTGDLTLDGTVTFNFNAVSALVTGQQYDLLTGTSGTWTASSTFAFNAPSGYALDTSYGTGGYLFDAANHTFSVEFVAVPEPTTWAMLLLSLTGLIFVRRNRSRIEC